MVIAPEDIEWHDANQSHATRHGVGSDEITQALVNGPTMRRNRKGRAASHLAYGTTNAGRRVVVAVGWNEQTGTLAPDRSLGAHMTGRRPTNMTEAEEADYLYEHRADPDLAGEQVAYTPPRGARVAVRLSFDEERRIRNAAERAGMTMSEFIRQVATAATDDQVVDIERIRRDVEAARSRIDDAQQALG